MSPFRRKRRVCQHFKGASYFKPSEISLDQLETVTLELDELEALRLCDDEGLHQSLAAEKMKISTSTLQRLLYSGRKKLIDAIYRSKAIKITNEEINMPKHDHTGPKGLGPKTGRKMGQCTKTAEELEQIEQSETGRQHRCHQHHHDDTNCCSSHHRKHRGCHHHSEND